MMRVAKLGLVAFVALFCIAAPLGVAAEEVLHPACQGFSPDDPNAPTLCKENANPQDPVGCNSIYGECGIITKVVKILSVVIGIASVIMIIIGGLKYVLSSGDPNSINSAKNTIIYALVGLVIAAMAQFLIIFVLSKL